SPIKFVTGSKLANHLMIDSLTLSLFSFQRAFLSHRPEATFLIYHITTCEIKCFLKLFSQPLCVSAAATFVNIAWITNRSQH
ncbi:hypothetical protein, partial [Brevibacillus porteri]|uniref:hypothetical protein n=1 Tax=Brevibacillus porteri TaxID=2126350 RepID=UPI0036355846